MGAIRRRHLAEHHWRRLTRDEALIEQGGRCKYCKRLLRRCEATADHVRPRSNSGIDEKGNIVAACYDCNQAKRSLSAHRFFRMLKGLEPSTHYRIAVQGVIYRLEKRVSRAEQNILALVGGQP